MEITNDVRKHKQNNTIFGKNNTIEKLNNLNLNNNNLLNSKNLNNNSIVKNILPPTELKNLTDQETNNKKDNIIYVHVISDDDDDIIITESESQEKITKKYPISQAILQNNKDILLNPYEHIIQIKKNLLDKKFPENSSEKKIISDTEIIDIKSSSSSVTPDNRYDIKDEMRNLDEFLDEFKTKDLKRLNSKRGITPNLVKNNTQNNKKNQQLNAFDQYLVNLEKKYTKLSSIDKVITWDNQSDVSDVEDVINFEEKRKKLKDQYTQQNNNQYTKKQLLRRKQISSLYNFDINNKQTVEDFNDKVMKKPRKTKKQKNNIVNNDDDKTIDNNKKIKKQNSNGLNKINNNNNNSFNTKIIELFNNKEKTSILSAINKIESNYDKNNMSFKLPNSPKKQFIQQGGKLIDTTENKEEFYKYLGLGTKLNDKNKSEDLYDIKRRSLRVRRIQMEQQKQQESPVIINRMGKNNGSISSSTSLSKVSSKELKGLTKKHEINSRKQYLRNDEPKIKIICSLNSNTNTSMPAKIPSDKFRKLQNEIQEFLETDDAELITEEGNSNNNKYLMGPNFSELRKTFDPETHRKVAGGADKSINQDILINSKTTNHNFIPRTNGNRTYEYNKTHLNQTNISSKISNESSSRKSLKVREEIKKTESIPKCDSWIVCKRSYDTNVGENKKLKTNKVENNLSKDLMKNKDIYKTSETFENKLLKPVFVKKSPKNKAAKKMFDDNEKPDKTKQLAIMNELVKALKESKEKSSHKIMKDSKDLSKKNRLDLVKVVLQSNSISEYSKNLKYLNEARRDKIKIEFSKDYNSPKFQNKSNKSIQNCNEIVQNQFVAIDSQNIISTVAEESQKALEMQTMVSSAGRESSLNSFNEDLPLGSLDTEGNNLKANKEHNNPSLSLDKSSQITEAITNIEFIENNCSKIEQQIGSINNFQNNEITLKTVLSKTSIDSKSTKRTNTKKIGLEVENSNDSKQQKQLDSSEGREIWTRSKKLKIRQKRTASRFRHGKTKKIVKILVKQQTSKSNKNPVKRRKRLHTNSDKSINLCKTAAIARPLLNDEIDQKLDLNKLNNGKIPSLQNSKIKKEEILIQKSKIENCGNIDGNKHLNNLPNPLKFEKGDVFHAYFENNVLIVIQECCVSFWKYSKILQISGKEQEWQLLGECKRKLNDLEINSPYKSRIAMNDTNPVYIELRARNLDSSRECNLSSTYANIYYFDHIKQIAESRSIQLDNFKCAAPNIIFTTIVNTRYFIVCWKQDTILKQTRSGLCKYSLTPDLQTLASIREFKHLRHYVYSLECCDDDKLIAIGESQITIWEHRSGDVLMNFDLGIPIGKNLGSLMCTIELENYLFLYQLITNQDSDDDQLPELKIYEIKLENLPVYRLIQRHELSLQFDTIKSNLLFNEQYLIVTSITDEEFWLFIQQPQRLYLLNDDYSTQCKRFYSTNCKEFIEITGDYLNVKSIHENLLNFST